MMRLITVLIIFGVFYLQQDILTQQGKSERGVYRLVIPNKEIREVYILQIQEWFEGQQFCMNREPMKPAFKSNQRRRCRYRLRKT